MTRTLAPLLVLFHLTRTLQPMVLSLLSVKDQYLCICSDKFFARVCYAWNISEVASSPDCDAFPYVISRKSFDSIFNVQWKSNTSFQKSHWLFFIPSQTFYRQASRVSFILSTCPRDSWLAPVLAYVGPSTKSILHVNSDWYMLWTKTAIDWVFIPEYNHVGFHLFDGYSLRITVAHSIITRSQTLITTGVQNKTL